MWKKTTLCLMILLATICIAGWRAAAGLGPHVPLWALGVVVLTVLTWLHLPPRRPDLLGPARCLLLTVLSALSLTSLATGLVSFLAWTEVKVVSQGYADASPMPESNGFFAQARFGTLIAGYAYGGSRDQYEVQRKFHLYVDPGGNRASRWNNRVLYLGEFILMSPRNAILCTCGPGYRYQADGQRQLNTYVVVPFWFVTILLGLYPFAVLIVRPLRARRRVRAGFCPKCRYNLTGLTVPRCPECGRGVVLPVSARSPESQA